MSIRKLTLLLPVIFIALALNGCALLRKSSASGGPELVVDAAVVESAMRGAVPISEFKGFGEVTLVRAGQRLTGKIDAARNDIRGSLSIQVYTAFGTLIAAISAEELSGYVNIDKVRTNFKYGDTMEQVPFPSARYITFGQFAKLLTASMPDEFWKLPAEPDTLARNKKKNTTTAVWNSDTLTVRAQIAPKTGQLGTVTFNYATGDVKFTMQFSRFKKGVPNEITVRENSKNYITVSYENMAWE